MARKRTTPSKPKAGVTVRMYCQGLGDCFLLTFPSSAKARPVHVMIDCGVLLGTADAKDKMTQVVDDLVKTTGGEIDLLVITHEHWDHISGFDQARDSFKKLKFKKVWLAWTEQPGHPVAERLRKEQRAKRKKLRASLAVLADRLTAAGANPLLEAAKSEVAEAQEVLDFFGPPAAAGGPLAAASTENVMDELRNHPKAEFRSPGERHSLPGAEDVNIYVLGPPTDVTKLKKDAPSKGKDEAYELKAARLSLLGALAWATDGAEAVSPFEAHHSVPQDEAEWDPFFRAHYGFPNDPMSDPDSAWRRIDLDWLSSASRLALKLDSDTNNTSLALAFELPDGRTLIFPGDAQIGNWQSWPDARFKDEDGKRVKSLDLLQRAVFYKVGHHGSHNATLKEGGLEAMTSGDLVAMIPVDQAMAKKKRWKMPFGPLYERLQELTLGRVLRADEDEKEFEAAVKEASHKNTPTQRKKRWAEFQGQVTFASKKLKDAKGKDSKQPLYVEYVLPLNP